MLMDDILEKLKDRLEGWEFAELLELSVEDIFYAFEDRIDEDRLEDIKELLNIEDNDEEEQ